MPTETVFLAVPLLVYLGLVALPSGRPALLGVALVAVLAAVASMLGLTEGNSGMLAVIGFLAGPGIAMAALVQLVRRSLGEGRPVWTYPALVLAGLVAGGWVIWQQMGI